MDKDVLFWLHSGSSTLFSIGLQITQQQWTRNGQYAVTKKIQEGIQTQIRATADDATWVQVYFNSYSIENASGLDSDHFRQVAVLATKLELTLPVLDIWQVDCKQQEDILVEMNPHLSTSASLSSFWLHFYALDNSGAKLLSPPDIRGLLPSSALLTSAWKVLVQRVYELYQSTSVVLEQVTWSQVVTLVKSSGIEFRLIGLDRIRGVALQDPRTKLSAQDRFVLGPWIPVESASLSRSQVAELRRLVELHKHLLESNRIIVSCEANVPDVSVDLSCIYQVKNNVQSLQVVKKIASGRNGTAHVAKVAVGDRKTMDCVLKLSLTFASAVKDEPHRTGVLTIRDAQAESKMAKIAGSVGLGPEIYQSWMCTNDDNPQQGVACILMQYLKDTIPLEEAKMDPKDRVRLFLHLFKGLVKFHQAANGSCHEDIHGRNVLVAMDLSNAWIIDYGFTSKERFLSSSPLKRLPNVLMDDSGLIKWLQTWNALPSEQYRKQVTQCQLFDLLCLITCFWRGMVGWDSDTATIMEVSPWTKTIEPQIKNVSAPETQDKMTTQSHIKIATNLLQALRDRRSFTIRDDQCEVVIELGQLLRVVPHEPKYTEHANDVTAQMQILFKAARL